MASTLNDSNTEPMKPPQTMHPTSVQPPLTSLTTVGGFNETCTLAAINMLSNTAANSDE